MVTASFGTLIFKGRSKTYSVDFAISDVIGANCTFDSGQGASATSLSFWKVPENVILTDIAIVTGNTVTTNLIPSVDGQIIGGVRYRETIFLSTLATRPALGLGISQGRNFSLIQA